MCVLMSSTFRSSEFKLKLWSKGQTKSYSMSPVLANMATERPVAVSGLIPGCPAANLAGQTLLHAGLKSRAQQCFQRSFGKNTSFLMIRTTKEKIHAQLRYTESLKIPQHNRSLVIQICQLQLRQTKKKTRLIKKDKQISKKFKIIKKRKQIYIFKKKNLFKIFRKTKKIYKI